MAPDEDMKLEDETLTSSPNQSQETEEESLDNTPDSRKDSLASDCNSTDSRNVDHAMVEETVHRVVQEVGAVGQIILNMNFY